MFWQEPGQTFDDYLTEMRNLSSDCDLLESSEWLLTDMLITSLNNKSPGMVTKRIQPRFN